MILLQNLVLVLKEKKFKKIETKLIHSGEPEPRVLGAVSMPIFQSAMFETRSEPGYHNIEYIRLNNTPNARALHAKLAAIEGAEDALVASSGMAAISTTLLTFLHNGDHLLVQNCLYGGTQDFVNQNLQPLRVSHDFIYGNNPETWE